MSGYVVVPETKSRESKDMTRKVIAVKMSQRQIALEAIILNLSRPSKQNTP